MSMSAFQWSILQASMTMVAASQQSYQPSTLVQMVHAYYRPACPDGGNCTDFAVIAKLGDELAAVHKLEDAAHEPAVHYLEGVASVGVLAFVLGIAVLTCCTCLFCCCCCSKPSGSSVLRWLLLACFAITGCLTLGCIGGRQRFSAGADDTLSAIYATQQVP